MSIKLPFNWLPSSIGLKGKARDIAQAEYELTGYELERKLLEINVALFSDEVINQRKNELNHRYKRITEKEYRRIEAGFIKDPNQRALADLQIDHDFGDINDNDYQKKLHSLNSEPWVNVIKLDFTTDNSTEGSFALDWNDEFVDKLRAEGYAGATDDQVVNSWFMEVCRNVALEEFDGTGDFTSDSEANLEKMRQWHEDAIKSGRRVHN